MMECIAGILSGDELQIHKTPMLFTHNDDRRLPRKIDV
uniref:Uncharacterized protein n=1 Tax=Rhizophora mucronata TaxID=61149 RepID=A0A2P2PVH0_RHIMU